MSAGVAASFEAPVAAPLLSVEDLSVAFVGDHRRAHVLADVGLTVARNECVAIVGESGSGKSVTALSILRLLPKSGRVLNGRVVFQGRDLLTLADAEIRKIRGASIGMIFQDPMTSLNPILSIEQQVGEALRIHKGLNAAQARSRTLELLSLVGIPDPPSRLAQYPHQLSGGMRQRVMIAIGISCDPALIIADEPTTALDVTIQAQILDLMRELSQRLQISVIIITHNLGVVARYAERVIVMYAGQVVEQGPVDRVFHSPRHLYTAGLLSSLPRLDNPKAARLDTIDGLPPDLGQSIAGCRFGPRCPHNGPACRDEPVLREVEPGRFSSCVRARELATGQVRWRVADPETERVARVQTLPRELVRVEGLTRYFASPRRWGAAQRTLKAVDGVSLRIDVGETLGLVGESGCGKSTVGRMLVRLETPTAGRIDFDGRDVTQARGGELRDLRRRFQMIFQDPYASLNPRRTIGQIIAEPLQVHRLAIGGPARRARVDDLLRRVGLRPELHERYPHQISGGQRQRVGIARALAMEPSFIVCDEAVSALDVSIQGQIVNLLEDLQRQLGIAYLFIAHDLAVVRHISKRVAVMYLGRIVETCDSDSLYREPLHPYTRVLLEAVPSPDPQQERGRVSNSIRGEPPSPFDPPSGCAFRTRCPIAVESCSREIPHLRELRPQHQVACLRA